MTTWTDDENGGTVWSEDEAAGTALGAANGASLVGFTASGSGAVSTTVQAEIRAIGHRFESYGALGDGTTDDQAAIQRALTAAAGGGVAYGTPGKTYIVASDLAGVTNATLYLPKGCTIKAKAATDVNVLSCDGISNFRILGDGVIDGNLANQTGQVSDSGQADGLRVETCSNVVIKGITVQNTKGWGVHVGASTEVLADGITVSGTQEKAFNFTGSTARSSVVNSFISAAGGGFFPAATGIEVDDAAHDILVQNNVINGTAVTGISVHGHESEAQPYNVNVIGNVITSAGNIGIRVASHRAADDNLRRVTIANNIINGTDDGAGISVITNGGSSTTTSEDIVITGNQINDANDQGITVSLGKRIRIAHNVVRSSGDHGIQVDGGATAADLAQYVSVEENNVISTGASKDGIHVANSSVAVRVLRNLIVDAGRYSVNVRDSDNDDTWVKGNTSVNPTTGHINNGGTRTIFDDPVVIAQSGTAVSVTATTAEEALATITIPAGAMGANGSLRIRTTWAYTNGADDKICRVRLGGIGGTAFYSNTATTTAMAQSLVFIANVNSQSVQTGYAAAAAISVGTTTATEVTGAVDTSASTTLVISGQKETSGDTLTLKSYTVELIYRP